MRKAAPIILILVLALIALVLKRWTNISSAPKKPDTSNQSNNRKATANVVNRNRGFDRRISYLDYTEHAKCRMRCRHITQKEVQEIMRGGKINYNKTEVDDKPCPIYAVEGTTTDQQRVRIVVAQCDEKSKVITVIDLTTEWVCDCPGE